MKKKIFAVIITVSLLLSVVINVYAEGSAPVLTFTDGGITETTAGSGYTTDGTALAITADGVYRICGSCSEGSISVNKNLTGVVLILDNLSLASSKTAPIVIKKSAAVTVHLTGTSTLTDNEDPAAEATSDTFEGAAIKVKSGSALTVCGDGDLNIVANAKNGIKGGSTSSLIFNQSGKIKITGSGSYKGGTKSGAAVNSGIACDGSIVINRGSYNIKSAGDGIRSAPDATNAAEGTTIDKKSAGTITINGGTFQIKADGDGIEADTALNINGGTFEIDTWKGSSEWNDTLADTLSCKGLKAAGDRATEAGLEPAITITNGTFILDTGDDAVHSDAYITITGGAFDINTGDDGMHAATSLTLGTENGLERDPGVSINKSYEGLEGGSVYIYSGYYFITARDDGVNAAGGSSNGSDPGSGGGHHFNPGGGPGGPGGGPGWPGGPGGGSSSSDYNIYIYGGDLYIDCKGDGIDSNGGIYLYGGRQAVFSMGSGGDNSALDSDGTMLIQGATVFTAGTPGVDGRAQNSWFGSGQKYAVSTASYKSGAVIDTKAGSDGDLIFSYALVRDVNYVMASWPSSVSNSTPSFSKTTAVTSCKGGSQSHVWDEGTLTDGVKTYTCSECGATESRTVFAEVQVPECAHLSGEEEEQEDEGFAVAFAGDSGVASVTVYTTQDYAGESVSVNADGATVSRSSDTGKPDSTGNGQVNFTVVLNEGYALSNITVTAGTYKNIKGPTDTGLANTYRITKITSDTTITITTVACGHTAIADGTSPSWVWSEDFGTASLTYTCAECGEEVSVAGIVTSELTNYSTVTFTAKASIGETEYTDSKTAAPFRADFSSDEGVMYIYVYHTQDYTEPDDDDASGAVARSSDSGCPVITGDGQINFAVVLNDGYEIDDITATPGAYKNIKGPADTGAENTYRITKINKDLQITITTKKSGPPVAIEHGDCNKDGKINNKDVTILFRFISSGEAEELLMTDAYFDVYDFNRDGEINNKDVIALFRYVSTI